jgi:Large eukaryotic DNA virus major capsid protein/Major capsid protein N-terminus
MAVGGVFQLITNTGMQDRLLMATQLLNDRLKEIRRIRCKNPAIRDDTPTLIDIERTHVLFINSHFKPFVAIGYEYQATGPQFGIVDLGQQIVFSIPQFGDFFSDMVLHVQLSNFTAAPGDKVFYCDFLGHRLMQLTKFKCNGNYLDQYDYNVLNFHYNFFVTPQKQISWLRGVGQEVPEACYLTHNVGVDEFREVKYIASGPQTPKAVHQVVDLWIPLLFWFNLDVRLAIPSLAVPYGQRWIEIQLAEAEQICFSNSGAAFTPPTITTCDLYINNIFINPDILDIFINRIGFAMIRVHLGQVFQESVNVDEQQLNLLKFPIETIYFGMQPDINLTGVDQAQDWWRYHQVVKTLIPFPVAIPNATPPPTYSLGFSQGVWRTYKKILLSAAVTNHGVQLYPDFPFELYNTYLPYHHNPSVINSPVDPGLGMITFNLFPGSYQPSGSVNFSMARETYLSFSAQGISSINPCQLFVIGIAINFLLVAQGTLVLRFST